MQRTPGAFQCNARKESSARRKYYARGWEVWILEQQNCPCETLFEEYNDERRLKCSPGRLMPTQSQRGSELNIGLHGGESSRVAVEGLWWVSHGFLRRVYSVYSSGQVQYYRFWYPLHNSEKQMLLLFFWRNMRRVRCPHTTPERVGTR